MKAIGKIIDNEVIFDGVEGKRIIAYKIANQADVYIYSVVITGERFGLFSYEPQDQFATIISIN